MKILIKIMWCRTKFHIYPFSLPTVPHWSPDADVLWGPPSHCPSGTASSSLKILSACVWSSYHLFTLPLLSKQTRHGRNMISSISFCLYVVALNVYRASNVRVDACNSSCLVLQLQSVVYLEQWLNNRQRSWKLARIVTNTVQLWLQLFCS